MCSAGESTSLLSLLDGLWTRIKQAASWRQLMKKEKKNENLPCPFHSGFSGKKASHQSKNKGQGQKVSVAFGLNSSSNQVYLVNP